MSGLAPIDDLHGLRATREGSLARAAVRLASKSPRRADLLRRHGIEFAPIDSRLDDSMLAKGAVTPAQWVASLAFLKASGGLDSLRAEDPSSKAIVLGADTVVVKEGRVIGQPRDADDAIAIVRTLENGEHEVITGVALLAMDGRRLMFTDSASVRVGVLGDDRIVPYIASGGWRGKAGAYNLEERLHEGWPIEFKGDPSTIMGLPMTRLAPVLTRMLGQSATEGSRLSPC